MALKLDNALLEDLGLGALPEGEKQLLLRQIYEKLEMNVGVRLADQMSNEQLDEFEKFVDANDDKGAFQWLETNFPNYKDVVNSEFEKLKIEIKQYAPQMLAVAQQNAQNPQAPQVGPAGQQPYQPQQPGGYAHPGQAVQGQAGYQQGAYGAPQTGQNGQAGAGQPYAAPQQPQFGQFGQQPGQPGQFQQPDQAQQPQYPNYPQQPPSGPAQ